MFAYAKPEQKQTSKNAVQKKDSEKKVDVPNLTGIPDTMKTRFENISGFSFDDVRVHYNSDKPVQLQALAYTQGNQVYVAPGQEKHLGHELGHVVQQKQGRVDEIYRYKNLYINDNLKLEREADDLANTPAFQKTLPSLIETKNHSYETVKGSTIPVIQRQLNLVGYPTEMQNLINQFNELRNAGNINTREQEGDILNNLLRLTKSFGFRNFHKDQKRALREAIVQEILQIPQANDPLYGATYGRQRSPNAPATDNRDTFLRKVGKDFASLSRSGTAGDAINLLYQKNQANPGRIILRPSMTTGAFVRPRAFAGDIAVGDPGGERVNNPWAPRVDIGYDSKRKSSVESRRQDNPREIMLAHELIHAIHSLYGTKFTPNTQHNGVALVNTFGTHPFTDLRGAQADDAPTTGLGDREAIQQIYQGMVPDPQQPVEQRPDGNLRGRIFHLTENDIRRELDISLRSHY